MLSHIVTPMITTTAYEVWSRVTETGEILSRHGRVYNVLKDAKSAQFVLASDQSQYDAERVADGHRASGVEYFLAVTTTTREEYKG